MFTVAYELSSPQSEFNLKSPQQKEPTLLLYCIVF